jgi:hypothetical protein
MLENTNSESDHSIETEDDDSDAETSASPLSKLEGLQNASLGTSVPTTSTLRSRRTEETEPPSITTGTAYSTSSKFGATKRQDDTRENILISDRVEREKITEDLLDLTKQLKGAQKTLHQGLVGEKKDLNLTVQGLDKNVDGMEAAGQRMGTLRRMTEGKGFFGRMMLYAYIAGLWVLALVIVFVLPKLRF